MDHPTITVTSLGRHSLQWLPTGEEAATTLSPELEERRQALIQCIQTYPRPDDDGLPFETDKSNDRVHRTIRESELQAALVVASDAQMARHFLGPLGDEDCNLDGEDLEYWLVKKVEVLVAYLKQILGGWTETNNSNGQQPRPSSDKRARSGVRRWYNNLCILTGTDRSEDAHIIPVRVTTSQIDLRQVWVLLEEFLPLERRVDIVYRVREQTNILPLSRGAHGRWDAFEFYLRPIADPSMPDTRLFLQLVWASTEDTEYLIVGTPRGDAVLPEITNGRRPISNAGNIGYSPICSGDVFLLETADPANCPLPSLELLQIQAGVHRILGGLRAAAPLEAMFRGPPPDDAGDDAAALSPLEEDEEDDLPHLWRVLLEAAVNKHVLSVREAGHWARAFVRYTREMRKSLESDEDSAGDA